MKQLTVFTFMILLIASCTTDSNRAIEHFKKAKELLKKDNIKDASSEIETAISIDSTNIDFQIFKAKIIENTNNYEQAILILKKLLDKSYKLDTVNFEIGSCYFGYGVYFLMKQNDEEKGKDCFEKSLTYYNQAININTEYFNAYKEKHQALHNLHRYDEALIVLNTAINLYPDSIYLILGRGVEKLYLGDLTGAMFDLNKSIQSNKLDSVDMANAYRFRANLYLEKENTDQAIIDLTDALKFNPKDEFALAIRAQCYRKLGLKDKACEDYRKAADLGYISIYETIKEYCN